MADRSAPALPAEQSPSGSAGQPFPGATGLLPKEAPSALALPPTDRSEDGPQAASPPRKAPNASAFPPGGEAGPAKDSVGAWRQQIAGQKEAMEQKVAGCHPALKVVAEPTFKWLDRAALLCQKWQESVSELNRLRAERDHLREQLGRTQQRVEAVGQTHSIGLLLRKQLAALPEPRYIQGQIRSRQAEIQTISLELFDIQDRQAELKNLEGQVQRWLQQLGPAPEGMTPDAWQEAIGDLVALEQKQLEALLPLLHRYFETLVELDQTQTELLRIVREYRSYINERILWIRSTPVLGTESFRHGIAAAAWLVRRDRLKELLQGVWEGVKGDFFFVAGLLAVTVVWGYMARKFRRRIAQLGELAQQEDFCKFVPTVQTVGMTLAGGMWTPAVLWLLPWALGWTLSPMEFLRALAEAFRLTAWVLIPWELLRASCQPVGLAEAHFGWPEASMRVLRRWLRTMMSIGLPCLLVASLFHYQTEERFDSSLGRIGFLGLMAIWAIGWGWLFRSKGSFVQALADAGRRPWWMRFRLAVYWIGVLSPVGLAVLAGAGYYYTAQQLAWRLYSSLAILVAAGWFGAILRRGILILRRRIARSRTGLALAGETPPPTPPEPIPPPPAEKPAPLPDLTQVSLQVEGLVGVLMSLVAVGLLGLIWIDILPALAMLKRIPLWTISWSVSFEATSAGAGAAAPPPTARWVTAADLLWAAVVLLLTYLGAKNLPALLELMLPEKLPLDQGARYALKTLLQYAVVLIGLLVGLPPLGITWNRMQWLVAALGVGLGFGLQEIFANFVSGLILLFERPIRVGDIITIGDVTGVVAKIHIRATIITNWDRQDLIVPNKEFITGRVLNWTLTNLTNRIVLQVPVAYGTDPDRIRGLLTEILRSHPLILREPPPLVTLENLGDSALQFTIRAYLPTLDKRLETIHELYTAIHNRFRQEGIEIPFPQRQVHIRSWSSQSPVV